MLQIIFIVQSIFAIKCDFSVTIVDVEKLAPDENYDCNEISQLYPECLSFSTKHDVGKCVHNLHMERVERPKVDARNLQFFTDQAEAYGQAAEGNSANLGMGQNQQPYGNGNTAGGHQTGSNPYGMTPAQIMQQPRQAQVDEGSESEPSTTTLDGGTLPDAGKYYEKTDVETQESFAKKVDEIKNKYGETLDNCKVTLEEINVWKKADTDLFGDNTVKKEIISSNHDFDASDPFKYCLEASTKYFPEIKDDEAFEPGSWKFAWFEKGRGTSKYESNRRLKDINDKHNSISQRVEEYTIKEPSQDEIIKLSTECAALKTEVSQEKTELYESHIRYDYTTFIQCAAASVIMQKYANYNDDYRRHRSKQSLDGKIVCRSAGVETVDFPACLKLLNIYDTAAVTQVMGEQWQSMDYSATTAKAQAKAASSINDPVAPLEAQKSSIEKQQDIANQRAIFQGARLALMLAKATAIPTTKTLLAYCKKHADEGLTLLQNKLIEKVRAFVPKDEKGQPQFAITPLSTDSICSQTVNGKFHFILNTAAKEAGNQEAVNSGMSMAALMLMAKLFGDQVDDINGALSKIESMNPKDWSVEDMSEKVSVYCQLYPTDPRCSVAKTNPIPVDVGMLTPSITIESPTQNDPTEFNEEADEQFATSPTDDDPPTTGPAKIPEVGVPKDEDNSFKSNISSAVPERKPSPAPAGGGGGGGGGNSSNLSGGGGGGGSGPRPTGPGIPSPIYTGGVSGGYTIGGNGAMGRNNEEKEVNPFEGLKPKTDNSPSTTNFRDIASKEGDSIFDRISKRYQAGINAKKFLEYEIKQ